MCVCARAMLSLICELREQFQAEFSWESPLIVSPSPPPPAPNLLAHKSGLIVGAAIGTAAVVVVVMWVGFRVSVRASSPPKPPSGDATKTVSPTSPELQVASQLELVRPVIAFRTPAKDVRFVPSPMVSRQGTSSSVSVPIMPLPPPWLRQPRRWTPRARRSSTSRGPPASMSPLFVLRNQAAATKTPGPAAPKQNT